MIKRFICIAGLIVLLLCGCTSHNDNNVIKFATWGSASEINILKPIISEFEYKNPNIKVELMHIPQNYFQKIHLLFASNLAPDVIFINNINLPIYTDYLEPVIIDNSKYYLQAIKALSFNGNLYAVPRDISNLVIFYNKNLFDKCKVEYPKSDWTIDNFLKISKTLTSQKENIWGFASEEDIYYLMPLILTFHECIYPPENVNNLSSIKFFKALSEKYKSMPTKADIGSKTIAQMFLEGKVAMHISGRWLVPKYNESKLNYGVINFPGIVPCDASGWAISKQSNHKKEARLFVDFISSPSNIEKISSSGLIVPARKDVEFGDKIFLQVIDKSENLKISKKYNKILDELNAKIFSN